MTDKAKRILVTVAVALATIAYWAIKLFILYRAKKNAQVDVAYGMRVSPPSVNTHFEDFVQEYRHDLKRMTDFNISLDKQALVERFRKAFGVPTPLNGDPT